MTRLFRGAAPALVTPFTDDNRVDHDAFRALIDRQIEAGTPAIVVLGTTGENATVSPVERQHLVDTAIAHVNGRLKVIVGTGNNSTEESIAFSRQAAAQGADGLLVVGPYYNKPPQAGFRAHVAAIADATPCPIILYNVPGRTGFDAHADTTLSLAETVPSVVGVKEASGNLARVADLIAHRPDGFGVYSGDDELTLFFLALGADGVISVVSNVAPCMTNALVGAALQGRSDQARALHFAMLEGMRACFLETNPIPVKAALARSRWIRPGLRLPLVPMSAQRETVVLEAFADLQDLEAKQQVFTQSLQYA